MSACGDEFTDCFGIQKLYADAGRPSNNWTFSGNPRDPRFLEQHIVAAGQGWFRPVNPQKMRVQVVSDVAADEEKIRTFDISKVLAKGFLFKPPNSPDGHGDFLNIEQTWRLRVVSIGTREENGGPHIELVPGGLHHTSSRTPVGRDKSVPAGCEAMSYHFNLYPTTGRAKLEKESEHTSGYTREDTDPERKHAVPPFADGREMVEKAVLYRTAAGMKLELYVDATGKGTHFDKVLEYEDRGEWGPTIGGNSDCHCPENVVLSMARVAIGYRCDDLRTFLFRDMSVRSIDPQRRL